MEKTAVSPEWSDPERLKVVELIQAEMARLAEEEKKLRGADHMDASCIAENAAKRRKLLELQFFVDYADSIFLEANREKFGDFIL